MRSATQREYTTPTLKPGTRYEVEVWAVTSIGESSRRRQLATTYQGEYFYTGKAVLIFSIIAMETITLYH